MPLSDLPSSSVVAGPWGEVQGLLARMAVDTWSAAPHACLRAGRPTRRGHMESGAPAAAATAGAGGLTAAEAALRATSRAPATRRGACSSPSVLWLPWPG